MRNTVCNIFREIGFYDFPRNWCRGNSRDASLADILSPRSLSPRLRIIQRAPTSPQQVDARRAIHGLILESVRKRCEKPTSRKIPSVFREKTIVLGNRSADEPKVLLLLSRKGHRESMPPLLLSSRVHLLLPGSPSPTPRNPQVAGVRAGYRRRLAVVPLSVTAWSSPGSAPFSILISH